MYKLSWSLVLTSASYRYIKLFINVLPEALQTCYVDVMLLLMDCVCILTFIVVTLGCLVTYRNSSLL